MISMLTRALVERTKPGRQLFKTINGSTEAHAQRGGWQFSLEIQKQKEESR